MKHINSKYIFTLLLCYTTVLHPITFVYNLRIGETTRTRNTAFGKLKPSVAAITPLAIFRNFETDFHQSAGGVLGTYIYATDNWYARINAAVGRVHADSPTIDEFGKTEFDDFLFTAGYSWQMAERTRVTLSGHFGVPLHSDYIGDPVELGIGHVGLGLQLDGLHAFNKSQILLVALRALYFFPRRVTITLGDISLYFPHFKFGDVADFLISYQHQFGKERHMLGVGYNPTFTFGTTDPTDPLHIHTLSTMTNSFFGTYRYAFPIKEHLSAIILGFSYGFLNVPAPLNHGQSATIWLTWGINF